MNFLKNNKLAVALILAVMVASLGAGGYIGFGVGYKKGVVSLGSSTENISASFSPFWKAWSVLNDKSIFASSTTDQDKVWGAIEGLASSYKDPYTVFFPPVESQAFESDISGQFVGVGMEVGMKDGAVTVVSPLKGSPAEKAGIKSGDIILAINGKPPVGLSIDEVVQLIRGDKAGTVVTVTVGRAGVKDPIDIKITRNTVDIPTIETKNLANGIFMISLYNFSAVSPDLFQNALRDFVLSGDNKLIIDLRGNPGGYLDAAIDMASWFLPVGSVVVKENFGDKQPEIIHRSHGPGMLQSFGQNIKLVMLVDDGSASASEILAGALQENKIATLVGTNTFGKGSVQELVKITPDTSLKITVAKWLTPSGKSISDGGLKPDVEVKVTQSQIDKGIDAQLNKAEEILK